MGYDYIRVEHAVVGFHYPIYEVFNRKCSCLDLERIHTVSEQADFDYEGKTIMLNPHLIISMAWSEFLAESHPELVHYGIQPHIGFKSLPGMYEVARDPLQADVVFGYRVGMDIGVLAVDATAPAAATAAPAAPLVEGDIEPPTYAKFDRKFPTDFRLVIENFFKFFQDMATYDRFVAASHAKIVKKRAARVAREAGSTELLDDDEEADFELSKYCPDDEDYTLPALVAFLK